MRLLLDTHVLLWSLDDPGQLAPETAEAIADPGNEVVASAVSAWEIAIKQSLGKLALPGPAMDWLPRAVEATSIDWIAITRDDALRVGSLPWHHRDPFDRLIVAQALTGYTLVTHDPVLRVYGVPILPATREHPG